MRFQLLTSFDHQFLGLRSTRGQYIPISNCERTSISGKTAASPVIGSVPPTAVDLYLAKLHEKSYRLLWPVNFGTVLGSLETWAKRSALRWANDMRVGGRELT
jgi:hypothetical protein